MGELAGVSVTGGDGLGVIADPVLAVVVGAAAGDDSDDRPNPSVTT
jgi:hypothetical protein